MNNTELAKIIGKLSKKEIESDFPFSVALFKELQKRSDF